MRTINLVAECLPPPNLVAIGARPERMNKKVTEEQVADATREFIEACRKTGIFACHGTVMMTFTVQV